MLEATFVLGFAGRVAFNRKRESFSRCKQRPGMETYCRERFQKRRGVPGRNMEFMGGTGRGEVGGVGRGEKTRRKKKVADSCQLSCYRFFSGS